jgi:hypothetical protein
MIQLADLFSVPEMYLMLTVTEYFNRNHIDYHPEILFRDVKVSFFHFQETMNLHYLSFVSFFFITNPCQKINSILSIFSSTF